MIKEDECGIAVEPEKPEAFADALCRLADDPDLRDRYGRNSRILAENYFDRGKLGEQFVNFLEKAVK